MCKKFFQISLVALAILAFVSAPVFAGSLPSAKSGAAMSNALVVSASTLDEGPEGSAWTSTLSTLIKVAEQKDLVMDVSLQCALMTDTLTKSKGGKNETSTATASVKVHVMAEELIGTDEFGAPIFGDPKYSIPGGEIGVTYCSRSQILSAKFQGIIQTGDEFSLWEVTVDGTDDGIDNVGDLYDTALACSDAGHTCIEKVFVGTCLVNHDGDIILDVECLTDEEVRLVLDTVNANAFNFMVTDLNSGIWRVTAETMVSVDGSSTNGDYKATALVGLGSMTVEEIRLIQNDDGSGL